MNAYFEIIINKIKHLLKLSIFNINLLNIFIKLIFFEELLYVNKNLPLNLNSYKNILNFLFMF